MLNLLIKISKYLLRHISVLTNYPQHFPLDPLNATTTNHTWYINFLEPWTAVMRPMLDIPRTLSSQGVSSTAIGQAVYIHIVLLTIACLPRQLPL